MASLDGKIRGIVESYLRDDDPPVPGLSPCILKQMLQELALYVFRADVRRESVVHNLILDVLEQKVVSPSSDSRMLSAPAYVQWLCTQYGPGPWCTETAIEVLWRQTKILILRGGVQQLGRIAVLRRYIT